jgi:hypothetical protein
MESQLTTHNRRLETEVLARQGLRLPPITLKCLRTAGIYCQPSISIEHQHLAKKHVLRGVESGGAVAEVGAYASFVDEQGNALPWLQRVDSIGVNGMHAIMVASVLIRVQMFRIERTYDLLITRHQLAKSGDSPAQRREEVLDGGCGPRPDTPGIAGERERRQTGCIPQCRRKRIWRSWAQRDRRRRHPFLRCTCGPMPAFPILHFGFASARRSH